MVDDLVRRRKLFVLNWQRRGDEEMIVAIKHIVK
jgi:hypothetical protein